MLEQSIRFRARFLTALAVLSGLLFFGFTPANAADLNNASISGTVTVPAGVARGNLSIIAQSPEGHHSWGQLNDDGTFVVTDLPAGSYKVRVEGYASGALEQWYGGTSFETATEVIVTAGQSATGIDIVLVKGASIAGKISFPPGVDITYVNVYAQEDEQSNYQYGQINPDGTYKIVGLPAGAHRVHFSGSNSGAMDQWYGNAGSFQAATPLTLAAGQDLPGIDVTLVKGASISGRVTAPPGVDLSNINVSIRGAESMSFTGYGYANETGDYSVKGLPAGSYKVQFSSFNSGLLDTWYEDAESFESATVLTMSAGQDVEAINAELNNGASISGKLTAPAGVDLASVYAAAHSADRASSRFGQVDADGNYSIPGLTTGTYRIEFGSNNSGALDRWYTNGTSFETATEVQVAAGQALGGINATLVKSASISGVVTVPAGVDRNWVSVAVRPVGGSGLTVKYSGIAPDGSYKVTGFPAGNYTVMFNAFGSGALNQWYPAAMSQDAAATVSLSDGQDLSGVDATLVKGSSVAGKITAPAGTDMTALAVQIRRTDVPRAYGTSTSINVDGTYKFLGLSAGAYSVEFFGNGTGLLTQQGTDGKAIVLAAGQDMTGVNTTMATGAAVSGKLTVSTGVDVTSLRVNAYLEDGRTYASQGTVAPDGTYKVGGLAAGKYKIQFEGNGSGALDEWFDNAADAAAATTIVLTTAQERTGVNATLAEGGTISGKVVAAAGVNLSTGHTYATIFKADNGTSAVAYPGVAPDGSFSQRGLPAGNYKVLFSSFNTGAVSRWYGGSETFAAAATIAVAAGQKLTIADTTLVKGAIITGKITAPAGTDFSAARVFAYMTGSTPNGQFNSPVNSNGEYSITGLPAGNFKVKFDGGGSGAAQTWYGGSSESSATSLTLATSQTRSSIDMTTVAGATLTGKVSGAAPNFYPVDILDSAGNTVMNRYTNSDGTYSVQGLAAGSYKVAFNRSSGYTTEEAQFYNNKPESAGVAQAQSIVVSSGQSVPNVNATLVQGGSITGTATDQAGKPIAGAGIQAYTSNGSLVARTGVTDAAGKYSIPGLSTGQYLVKLWGSTPLPGDLYSGNSTSEAAATPVAVTAGKSTALNLEYATASLTTAVPTITGTAKVGSVLTAVSGTWGPSPVTLVYQWKASGIAITGATASTYKPVAADTGKTITVSVTGTKTGYTSAVKTSAATGTVMSLNPVLTAPAPTITGTAKVGSLLTAVPGTWGPSPVTLAYQWKASGIAITGATASTYKPVAADTGKTITVTVTGTKAGYTTAAKTSVATAAVARGTLTAPAPTITGTAKVGSLLTAVPGTWGPSPVTLTYQWKASGIAITGATASTYRPAAANVGKTITVTVTGTKTGYTTAAKTSVATAAVARGTLTAPAPTITGTAKVGSLLTAVPGTWGPSPVTLAYQWKASGIAITGATASTYRPAAANVGKTITVTVTGTKTGYTTAAKTSVATAAVARGTLTAPAPTITGTAKVGQLLTAVPGTWGPSPVTLAYQWKANGIAITGATARTYKLVAANTGKTITVTVTGSKAGYTTTAKTSVATRTVMALNPVLTAPVPTVAGTAKVGSLLTAAPGTWGPSPVALAYQWKANGIAITGATARTYTLATANIGKTITVTVTGTKAGYTTAAKTSLATAAVK